MQLGRQGRARRLLLAILTAVAVACCVPLLCGLGVSASALTAPKGDAAPVSVSPSLRGRPPEDASESCSDAPTPATGSHTEPPEPEPLSIYIEGVAHGETVDVDVLLDFTSTRFQMSSAYEVSDQPWRVSLNAAMVPRSILIQSRERVSFARVPIPENVRATGSRTVRLEQGRLISGQLRFPRSELMADFECVVAVFGSEFRGFALADEQGAFSLIAPWEPLTMVATATPKRASGHGAHGPALVGRVVVDWSSCAEIELEEPTYLPVHASVPNPDFVKGLAVWARCDGVGMQPMFDGGSDYRFAAWPGTWTVWSIGLTAFGELLRGEQTVRVDGPSPDRVHLLLVKAE